MSEPIQKRARQTRARLIEAAAELADRDGYEALRVEEIVARAGVAKGTFFAHFPDKDALMDKLIGARIKAELDHIGALPVPRDVDEIITAMDPLHRLMTSERYVFDIIIRHSGAVAREELGEIAESFMYHHQVIARWLSGGPFRDDISADLLAEGVGAFAIQAMSLTFCALHADVPMNTRLRGYLDAWLCPGSQAKS